MNRTHACFFLCLLLLGCLSCGDPPTSVMELVMPDNGDTAEPPDVMPVTEEAAEPETTDNVTVPLFEMEAILATTGEVHSPIPDDVYEHLWGHWTKIGLSTPRRYYTKYIDAGGIAIVGSDLVDDGAFQRARHVALVMTSKVPGLRDALSYNQPGGVSGDEVPFRFVLIADNYEELPNLPENLNVDISATIWWGGSCGTFMCRAKADDLGAIIHEMAHAINYAILERNLVPNFGERLEAAFEREMDKVRLRTEVDGEPYIPYVNADGEIVGIRDLPEWKDRPLYCMANSNSHDNSWEFWAWFVQKTWFDSAFNPNYRAADINYQPIEDTWRPECPNLVSITEEVFPAFPLDWAIHAKDYSQF